MTNNFKGLLILFVMMDHSNYLRDISNSTFIGLSFHVLGFYVAYLLSTENKEINFTSTILKSLKLYKSFLIFLMLAFIISFILGTKNLDFKLLAKTLIVNHFDYIEGFSGLSMLWFIPSFICFMFISLIVRKFSITSTITIILITLLIHFFYYEKLNTFSKIIPMTIIQTTYITALAWLCYFIIKYLNNIKLSFIQLAFIILICIKFIQIKLNLNQELGSYTILNNSLSIFSIGALESILGVLITYHISNNINFQSIIFIGHNSIKFYLLHPFIYYAFYSCTSLILVDRNIVLNLIFFVVTLTITFFLIQYTNRFKAINKMIFP